MTQGRPLPAIFGFALPLVFGYVLQQLYLIIDAAMVGRFVSVGALGAVGASGSVMFLILGFCNGAMAGFSIPVAQSFGARDYVQMRRYVSGAVRLGVALAVVLTVVCSLLTEQILVWMRTPRDILHDAWVFLLFQFLSIPFTLGYNLLSGFIRALGNSRQPFYFLIFASLLNIALDVLFILVLGMAVEGVGLATMLAQASSMVMCVAYIRRRLPVLWRPADGEEPAVSSVMGGSSVYRALLWNGLPMGLQFSITAVGSIMLQSANNALGTTCVAAFTAAMRVKYLFTTVFENIGVAMATYCGQNIGAARAAARRAALSAASAGGAPVRQASVSGGAAGHYLRRLRLGVVAALWLDAAFFVFSLAVLHPFADEMMLLFVDGSETAIIDHAALYMRMACYFFPCLAVLTALRYSIQGLGYSDWSMMSGVMEMFARVGVSLLLVPAWGFFGVCCGDPVAWVAADLFLIPCFVWLYRRLWRNVVVRG